MRYFYDNERIMIISETELKEEFLELKESECTTAIFFTEYINNCIDKNGTLTDITQFIINNNLQNTSYETIAEKYYDYIRSIYE